VKIVDRLANLSRDELRRMRTTLLGRYRLRGRGGVLEIGFGQAERSGRVDSRRPQAICFYVRRKRMPRRRQDRIPKVVEVRVRRQSHFVLVRLATDVLEVEIDSLIPTGLRLRNMASKRVATAGCVVAWRVPGLPQLQWGLLTVGHLFARRVQATEVRITIAQQGPLVGTLLARSQNASQVDGAIVQVDKRKLVDAGLISKRVSTRGKRVRAPHQLGRDVGRAGQTLPGRERVPFVVLRYLPETSLVPSLGTLVDVLDVSCKRAETFAPGRSGSLWLIERQAACQQFGGWETRAHPAENYRRGLGQSIARILDWARQELARIAGTALVDLRLIREL
jgi:hypothetical protein